MVAEPLERGVKQILVQLGGPVLVGVGKGGFMGGLGDAQMNQLAQATAQAVTNLALRIGMGELAEQYRDQLRPAAKAFGTPLQPRNDSPTFIIGGLFFSSDGCQICFGQE
jgi:hypothetical protein